MLADLVRKYDRAVPRYTSYPTADQFGCGVDDACYRRWLGELAAHTALSLYLHVPFCAELCWFCGCHTRVVRDLEPIAAYAEALAREIDLVADMLDAPRPVRHVHWGGGTPTILGSRDIRRLLERLRRRFDIEDGAEVAVEIDPRRVTRETVAALASSGVNRASLGVQDLDPAVQRAVNRIQPYDVCVRAVGWLRAHGITEISLDLMYGLPHQTVAGIVATVDKAVALEPRRLALFGYAHVPWMKRHQRLIDESALPDTVERLELFRAAASRLAEWGYVAVGLDHFALPDDPLAVAARTGRLRRNFQGYTTDTAPALLGFGASAISTLPQGYAQNTVKIRAYRKAVDDGALAVVRGVALTADDRLRGAVIERLMCDLAVDLDPVCRAQGADASALTGELEALRPLVRDGLVRVEGHRITVPDDRRPFLRVACAVFDRYLDPAATRHARAV